MAKSPVSNATASNTKSNEETKLTAQRAEGQQTGSGDYRNPAAPEDESQTTQPGDQVGGVDMRVANPREGVDPVYEGAKPITPARAADPAGTPGTMAPSGATDAEIAADDARERILANQKMPMRKMVITRDYFALSGERLKAVDPETATPDDAIEVPITDARYIEEAGCGQSADTFPFKPQAEDRKRK